jgi:RNA polymerase sigma factor (sigma-70 family)
VLNEYLRELHRVELLRPAEERRLWQAYKHRGSRRSRARLIEAYQPLVFKVAMALRLHEAVLMDMIQEGTVGLIQAVERFDPDRGVRFSTFATYRVRGRILNALRRERGRGADVEDAGEALAKVPDAAAADALASVEDAVLVRQIVAAIDGLPARERRILVGAFLAAEEPGRIADELKISLSHFYRLQQQALRKIRGMFAPTAHLAGRSPWGAPPLRPCPAEE